MTTQSPSLLSRPNSVVKKTSRRLGNYQIAYSTTALPVIAGNASSATFNPLLQTWMTSDNGVPNLQEFYLDGTNRRTITLSGFTDVEAVCWLEGTRYVIVEEGNPGVVNALCEVDIPQTGTITITKGAGNWIRTITTGIASGANLGIEGVAYDDLRKLLYCVTEKPDLGIWNVWQVARTGGTTTQLFSLNTPLSGVATDISDLYYDPGEDVLYMCSHEGFKLLKFSRNGTLLEQSAAPAIFTQIEGMCFTPDMGTMLLVGEARMYARMHLNRAIK